LDGKADVRTTWLCARPVDVPDSEWGVGCKASSWAAKSVPTAAVEPSAGPYISISVSGASLRLCNLRRHAASTSHQESVKAYLQRQSAGGASSLPVLGSAPPMEAFKDAWLGLRKSGGTSRIASDGHSSGVCSRRRGTSSCSSWPRRPALASCWMNAMVGF
jgi:hypothetical protein